MLVGDDMELASRGPVLMLKLNDGEDILTSIEDAVKNEQSTLLVTNGIGMITDFELGFFDRGNYIKQSYSQPHELVSMQGSVASEGEPRLHLHVGVADTDHRAFGGHLLRGKVWMSNEIGLLRLEGHKSVRRLDPVKKVGVLRIMHTHLSEPGT